MITWNSILKQSLCSFYSHYKRFRKFFNDIVTFCYRRCWRYLISYKWVFMKKAYSKYHQNLCDVQIRFKVCGSIRFEKPYSIISFGFCDLFFINISNIKLTLHIKCFDDNHKINSRSNRVIFESLNSQNIITSTLLSIVDLMYNVVVIICYLHSFLRLRWLSIMNCEDFKQVTNEHLR